MTKNRFSSFTASSSDPTTEQSSQTTPVKMSAQSSPAPGKSPMSNATRAQLAYLKAEVCQLRVDLKTLRHMQVVNTAKMREEMNAAFLDFKVSLRIVIGCIVTYFEQCILSAN